MAACKIWSSTTLLLVHYNSYFYLLPVFAKEFFKFPLWFLNNFAGTDFCAVRAQY